MTTAFFVYWNGRQHSLSTHCYGQKEPISLKVFCCLYPLHSFITLATRSSLVQGWKTKERQIWKGNSGTVLVLIVSQGLIFFLSACCFHFLSPQVVFVCFSRILFLVFCSGCIAVISESVGEIVSCALHVPRHVKSSFLKENFMKY